jgi:uncharacterized protein YjdB
VQDIGWTDWNKNGEIAGTTGQGKRIKAIEIKLVKSGRPSQSRGAIFFIYRGKISYQVPLNRNLSHIVFYITV